MTDRGGGILGGVSAPALDGLCVIEISETPAGAYAGRLLAGPTATRRSVGIEGSAGRRKVRAWLMRWWSHGFLPAQE